MKLRILLATIVLCVLTVPLANATVLTFDGLGTNTPMPAFYGSYVTDVGQGIERGNGFTPNVVVDFIPNGGNGFETYNDPDWRAAQLDGIPGTGSFDIVFTPEEGYGVLVNSFEFDDYADWPTPPTGHTFDWSLIGNDTTLAGATGVVVPSDMTYDPTGADNLVINTGMTSPFFGPVTLRIVPTAGDPYDRAIDDVNFDQAVVPEPASLATLGLAAALLLARHRRRSHPLTV
jgi:hypothetical protein